MSSSIQPRDYQVEAAKWAFHRRRAVVCMPTGTGKTVVAGLWIKWLLEAGLARRVLVLEPTRFLVEQVANFLRDRMKLPAEPLHGSLTRGARQRGWSSRIVVATPEIVVAEWPRFLEQGFEAVVVDECHHTTGQDAYRRVVRGYEFKYRLGLSAYIPPSRAREIEEEIGEIRWWGWDDPRIRPYIPLWEAEVYEAPLNTTEEKLYQELENLWERVEGHDRALVGNAIRWMVRDGVLALRETMEKPTKLSKLLEELRSLVYNPQVRPAHKLDTLLRVLRDHEGFQKAIVFIDRVVVAEYVHEKLKDYNPVLLIGRRRVEPREAVEKAREPESRVIIATSAGEEGIDLPEASLLVVWSHTASPLRFIQRLGRVLRATPQARMVYRWVVYMVTPDTVDVDSLIDSLTEARRAGVNVNIDPGVVEYVWAMSRRRRVLELIEEHPAPLDVIAKALGAPEQRVKSMLQWLLERGLAAYIHTPLGKVYVAATAVDKAYKNYPDSLTPDPKLQATIKVTTAGKTRTIRAATHTTALTKLQKILSEHGPIDTLRASITYEAAKGLYRLANLTYSFRIHSSDVLKMVIDNIYSIKNIHKPRP